jgi:substrate import-associated zinc metallohydrolase lipoprotein
MRSIYKLTVISSILVLFFSCRKEDELNVTQPVGLGGDTWARGAIDKWLLDSLTTPYNIGVKYRWEPWESAIDETLTPPDESKIIPAMSAVKRVWIDPYTAETGSELFIKRFAPKQFALVGSVQYNANGTVVLGQAEGGNNIIFFDINQNYDKNNITSVKRMIHTSHHEFAHVLHQNVLFPQEYKFISSNLGMPGYTATWFNVSEAEALSWGYITPYAMATYNEDFVEMVANMLMEGKPRFDEIVASTNAAAQTSLRQKEQIVVTYFREVWNIDFYSLQRRVQTALNAQVPPPTVSEAFGFGKTYTRASVNPANQTLLPQSATFMTIYNTSKNAVAAIPNFGLTMDSLAVIHNSATTAVVRMYIKQGTTTFFADFNHNVTKNANNTYTFTYTDANGNGNVIRTAVTPLLNYFANNTFSIEWYANPSTTIYPRVKFIPQAMPDTYFIGRLLL